MKIFFLLLFALTLSASPAFACECMPDAFTPEASKNNIAEARYIFEGKVESVEPVTATQPDSAGQVPPLAQNPNFSRITVNVQKLYKGPPETKTVTLYADTVTSCGIVPENVKNLDFFMIREFKGDLVLAQHCGDHLTDEDRKAVLAGTYQEAAASAPEQTATLELIKDGKPFDWPAEVKADLTTRLDRIARDCWLYMGKRTQADWDKAHKEGAYIAIKYPSPIETPKLVGMGEADKPERERFEEALFTAPADGAILLSPLARDGSRFYSLGKCSGAHLIAFQCRPELAEFFGAGYKKSCHLVKEWKLE